MAERSERGRGDSSWENGGSGAAPWGGGFSGATRPAPRRLGPEEPGGREPLCTRPGWARGTCKSPIGNRYFLLFQFPISYFCLEEDAVVTRRCDSGRFGREGDLFQGSRTRGIVTAKESANRSGVDGLRALVAASGTRCPEIGAGRSAEPGLYRDAPSLRGQVVAPYVANSRPY